MHSLSLDWPSLYIHSREYECCIKSDALQHCSHVAEDDAEIPSMDALVELNIHFFAAHNHALLRWDDTRLH